VRNYEQLLNNALDRFAQLLELRPDLREFLAQGPNFDFAGFADWQEDHGHIVEGCAEGAVPDDISDAILIAVLREKPALLSREGFAGGESIRELAIDGIRDFIEKDMLVPLGLHESQHLEAPAPKP
jgi:hypothetical protein